MNEIQKTTPGVGQQTSPQIEPVKQETSKEVQTPVAETTPPQKEINEIPDDPANRSVVKTDNLEADVDRVVKDPKLAEAAMAVGELAAKSYAEAGVKNPEEKGAQVAAAFMDEFGK